MPYQLTVQRNLNYINAKDYGASPNNTAAQNDTAFSAAISALGGRGTVLIPAGIFAHTGIVPTSQTDISIIGTGPGTILAPTTGNTAITLTGCTRCHVRDLKIDGSINGGAIGLSISGNFDSRFQNLHIVGLSGDAIYVNGDAAAGLEQYFVNVTCRNNGGYGYHHVRTTTTDLGGTYLTNFKANYDTRGLGGINIDASGAASTVGVFVTGTDVVVDGYSGVAAVQLHNTNNVRFTQLWAAVTNNSGPSVLIDGDGYFNDIQQGALINAGTGAGTYQLTINGTQHDNTFDDIDFFGASATANVHVGSTGFTNSLGRYNNLAGTLTDTASALYRIGANSLQSSVPIMVETSTGGKGNCFALDDIANASKQKWLRNNNGSLEFINAAFTQTVFRIDDGGFIFCGDAVQIAGNTAGSCALRSGSGAPGSGLGNNGDYYFRSDTPGTANQRIYVKSAGAWVGIV